MGEYNVEMATGDLVSSITSGEGLVCKFQGPGEVILQSHAPGDFIQWISPVGDGRRQAAGAAGGAQPVQTIFGLCIGLIVVVIVLVIVLAVVYAIATGEGEFEFGDQGTANFRRVRSGNRGY